jgi:hypothetical protein
VYWRSSQLRLWRSPPLLGNADQFAICGSLPRSGALALAISACADASRARCSVALASGIARGVSREARLRVAMCWPIPTSGRNYRISQVAIIPDNSPKSLAKADISRAARPRSPSAGRTRGPRIPPHMTVAIDCGVPRGSSPKRCSMLEHLPLALSMRPRPTAPLSVRRARAGRQDAISFA